jgi:hypothetical protein
METQKHLCPGYFERSVQRMIAEKGAGFRPYYCAMCGQQVTPVYKDGGWIPKIHSLASMTALKVNEAYK